MGERNKPDGHVVRAGATDTFKTRLIYSGGERMDGVSVTGDALCRLTCHFAGSLCSHVPAEVSFHHINSLCSCVG